MNQGTNESQTVNKDNSTPGDLSFSAVPPRQEAGRHQDVDMTTPKPGYFVDLAGRACKGVSKGGAVTDTNLIADGWAVIREIHELQRPGGVERSFVIACKPIDEEVSTFTIKAEDASNSKMLKAKLVNAFGRHPIGQLNLEAIQLLSQYTRTIKLFDRPQWIDGRLAAPGLMENCQFEYEKGIKIDLTTKGEIDTGVETLETFTRVFDSENAVILIAAMMGAPVIAKLWPGERFATFLVGMTGTHKTAAVQLLMSMWGEAYQHECNILRWGHGATANSLEHLAAMTGPFPFVIDDYKNYTDKDAARIQAVVHALCEGGEKRRMNKDSSMRESEEYLCMPIITGENYPGQDAASRARTVMLQWTKAKDLGKLAETQKHIRDLVQLGKEWCLWLGSDQGQDQLRQLSEKFDSARDKYLKDTGEAINAGRIATNAAIIALIWELLYNFPPMTDTAEELREVVEEAIKTHITQSRTEVSEDLDAERLMDWLAAAIETGQLAIRNYAQPIGNEHNRPVIGERVDGELLITPAVFKSIIIPGWQKSAVGARADDKSMVRQLNQRGYLKYDEKNQIFTYQRRIAEGRKRVYVFSMSKIMKEDTSEQQTAGECLRR